MKEFYILINKSIANFDFLIFEKLKVKQVYFLSLIYIVMAYGFGLIPGNSSYLISKNPFINIFRDSLGGQYNYDSILVPMLAYFTGLNSSRLTYALLNLFIILLANALFAFFSWKKFGSDTAKILIILFLLSPVSTILFTWLGSYDSATYFLQISLFLTTSFPLVFLVGFLGGLNHLPIVLISGTSLLLFKATNKEDEVNYLHLFIFFIGLSTGFIALKAYEQHVGIAVNIDRLSYLKLISLKHLFFDVWLSNWLTLPFSFYNVLWGIVLAIAHFLYFNYRKFVYFFAGSNILFLFFTVLGTADSTRIFSMLSWPLLFYSFIFVANKHKLGGEISYLSLRQYLSAIALIGFLVPRIYIFDGTIYFSNFHILFNFFKSMF